MLATSVALRITCNSEADHSAGTHPTSDEIGFVCSFGEACDKMGHAGTFWDTWGHLRTLSRRTPLNASLIKELVWLLLSPGEGWDEGDRQIGFVLANNAFRRSPSPSLSQRERDQCAEPLVQWRPPSNLYRRRPEKSAKIFVFLEGRYSSSTDRTSLAFPISPAPASPWD